MKPTLESLPAFLRGYLQAALFTTDPCPPSGADYAECGRADELAPRIPSEFLGQASEDCTAFENANFALLSLAGSPEQNGRDFWFTRNGHGVGFWDRGYPEEVSSPLCDACKAYGEHHLELGGWWIQEYRCKCGEEWTRPEDADNDPEFGTDTCDACGATVESENRKRGEHLTDIDEPEDDLS